MANYCHADISFLGDEKSVRALHDFFVDARDNHGGSFSFLSEGLEVDVPPDYIVSGVVYEVLPIARFDGAKAFSVRACSKWVFFPELFEAVISKIAPRVKMLFAASEPMMEYFETNDMEHKIYCSTTGFVERGNIYAV